MDGGGGAVAVAGGEKVQQGAAQHREDFGAPCAARLGVSFGLGLVRGEHGKPVFDGGCGEAGPWAVRVDQRARVTLDP